MKIKTYGINGLTDWYGEIKAGAISMKVLFRGGTASPSGAQPAYLVTKDPITQFVIENSKEFKNGFIHLEMSQDLPGEHPRMAVPKAAPVTAKGSNGSNGPDGADGSDGTAEAAKAVERKSYPDVTTAQAAREVLKADFGGTQAELQTAAAIRVFAEKKGVVFPNWAGSIA